MDNGKEQNFNLDQLNLDTNEMSWDYSPEHDSRTLGNKIITSPEATNASPDAEANSVSPTMPPGQATPTSEIQSDSRTGASLDFDQSALKTEDKLDARAVAIIDGAINKLDQDGNIADFYDTARGMVEINLKNSYNREIGA